MCNVNSEIPEICFKVADWWDGRLLQRRIVCAANRFELKLVEQLWFQALAIILLIWRTF